VGCSYDQDYKDDISYMTFVERLMEKDFVEVKPSWLMPKPKKTPVRITQSRSVISSYRMYTEPSHLSVRIATPVCNRHRHRTRASMMTALQLCFTGLVP
jgi:hypothetical protein